MVSTVTTTTTTRTTTRCASVSRWSAGRPSLSRASTTTMRTRRGRGRDDGWTRAALADGAGLAETALAAPTAAAAGRAALGVVAVGVGAFLSARKLRDGRNGTGDDAGSAGWLDGGNRRTAMTRGTGTSDDSKGRKYLIAPPPLFPLVPAFERQTYRYEVDPGRMWFFEQKQGIGLGLNVSVNVRMTVIKLKTGGLWVYAPVAPTKEMVALLDELDAPVEHVVLPTTLFEHKIFVGPFQRKYPEAQCWIVPQQWSWPVNLPPQFFGINKTGILGRDPTPWDDEFEVELLQPPALGVASYVSFVEAAIFHKPSKTLLVTDAVVYVSENIPDCIPDRDLEESGDDDNFTISALKLLNLFDIKTKAKSRTTTSKDMNREELLRLGWQRNALQALYFGPNDLLSPEKSWGEITNRLIVAPVVGTLVYENVPEPVNEWAKRVAKWNFNRIVPCHFDAPIRAGPREFASAFSFLPSSRPEKVGTRRGGGAYYPNEDMILLRGVADFLLNTGVIFTDETRPKRPNI